MKPMNNVRTIFAALLFLALPAAAQDGISKKPIHFAKGKSTATVKGTLKGRSDVDYIVRARAGQTMMVSLKASNGMNYFNVIPPGSGPVLFVGSTSGDRFEGKLPAEGDYLIRVYLMPAAARRSESSRYTLTVSVADPVALGSPSAPPGSKTAGVPFAQKLQLLGISFDVTSPNAPQGNTVKIVPAGLEADNTPVERPLAGIVVGAEVADLDADGSPEVYVYVRTVAGDEPLSLVALGANRRKSLSDIFLPDLGLTPGAAKGYRGRDEMAVVEGILARRFPVYGEGKDADRPTGRIRQVQYKLGKGEASWALKAAKVIEF
jgi:hypothetical protein